VKVFSILRISLVVAALLVLASNVRAMDPVQLRGEYQLAGRLEHNGATTPGKSHLYISLTDDAARNLYESLGGDPAHDPCTGYTVKAQGNVGCYEIVPNEQYFCSFSVNLERGAVEAGLGGCF
jgi:hypothetical protein